MSENYDFDHESGSPREGPSLQINVDVSPERRAKHNYDDVLTTPKAQFAEAEVHKENWRKSARSVPVGETARLAPSPTSKIKQSMTNVHRESIFPTIVSN